MQLMLFEEGALYETLWSGSSEVMFIRARVCRSMCEQVKRWCVSGVAM